MSKHPNVRGVDIYIYRPRWRGSGRTTGTVGTIGVVGALLNGFIQRKLCWGCGWFGRISGLVFLYKTL